MSSNQVNKLDGSFCIYINLINEWLKQGDRVQLEIVELDRAKNRINRPLA